jgi:hypothetical protein
MLEKNTRFSFKGDGEDHEETEEMSEEAPLGMDDVLEIIDPENLLDDDQDDLDDVLSDDEHDNGMEEAEPGDDAAAEEEGAGEAYSYIPERDDAKFTFILHKGEVYLLLTKTIY